MDYVPYFCKTCEKYLCKEHYHNEFSCNLKINDLLEEKINKNNKDMDINTICSFCTILINNNKGYECGFCKKAYCLKHRLEIDHRCPDSEKKSKLDIHSKSKNMIFDKLKNLKKK